MSKDLEFELSFAPRDCFWTSVPEISGLLCQCGHQKSAGSGGFQRAIAAAAAREQLMMEAWPWGG